jgi:putative membrane protein
MLIRWILSVIFLYVLSFLFSGIEISTFFAAVVAAAVLGLISVTVKPLLQIISLPITFLTLGLFYLVVNGLMLWLVSALVPGFSISGFWTAFFAAIVLSLLNSVFAGEK